MIKSKVEENSGSEGENKRQGFASREGPLLGARLALP